MTTDTIKLNISEQPPLVLAKLAELGVMSWPDATRLTLRQVGWTPSAIDLALGVTPKTIKAPSANGSKPAKPRKARTKVEPLVDGPRKDAFIAAWNDHTTVLNDVSRNLGIPVATMRRWAGELGLAARPRGRRPQPLPVSTPQGA